MTDQKLMLADKPEKTKKAPLFHPLSRRFHMILLLMSGFCCTTFMRMHLAITMTCMVNSTAVSLEEESIWKDGFDNMTIMEPLNITSQGQCSEVSGDGHHVVVDYGGTLVWSHKQQNIIFSGTFWGAIIVVLPSMFIVQRSSPRIVFLCAMIVYILSSAVTPFLANHFGYIAVFLIRAIMGLGEGVVLPSINAIIANWYPMEERSTALALFTTGNQLAGAGGNPIAAALCASSLGWPAIFYMCTIVGSAWSLLWSLASTNQPANCKLMTKVEREYLAAKVVTRSKSIQKSQSVPYRRVFTSMAFIAQLQCHFVINLIMCFLQLYLPTYLKDVLRLGVLANGTFIAVPNIFNFTFKVIWGLFMDKLKENKAITPTCAVKLSQSIANFGGGAALLAVGLLVDCSVPGLALIIFCFMYCCMGAFTSGFYTSLLSLAPRHTATLSSISQFASMLGRLCTPLIVGLIKHSGAIDEWRTLFVLAALVSIVSGTIFAIFGSGEIQEWGKEDVKEIDSEEVLELVQRTKTESLRMRLLICVFGLFSSVIALSCNSGEVYDQERNLCYLFVNNYTTWFTGIDYCNTLHYDYVSIHSAAQNTFIVEKSRQFFNTTAMFWTGALRNDFDSDMIWSDDSPMNYTNWNTDQPLYLLAIVKTTDGTWNTTWAYSSHPYVCAGPPGGYPITEPPPTAPPPPTTCRPRGPLCEPNAIYNNDNDMCYMSFFNHAYTTAENMCEMFDGHLASIHSDRDGSVIANGQFEWSDGSPVDYINWAPKQPVNPSVNRCVVLAQEDFFQKWYNVACNQSIRAFVCQSNSY